MPTSKRTLSVVVLIVVCVIGAMITYKLSEQSKVYTRTVTLEEGPLLSEHMKRWIEVHRGESGISAYVYDNDGVYELLLVDNRNLNGNQYIKTNVSTKQRKGILYLEYTDTAAVTENEVQYNEETYIILSEQPKQIKLTVNGEGRILQPEFGEEPITQP